MCPQDCIQEYKNTKLKKDIFKKLLIKINKFYHPERKYLYDRKKPCQQSAGAVTI
jgi:formate hydrogenlyase subunit 6/NADH:ubiquinone oxidoreductase subunit I